MLPDASNILTRPDMHRHSRVNKTSKQRSALLILLAIAVCSLLAVHPVLKGRTNSLLGSAKQKAKLQAIPDDSQVARERAQQLGLVPTGKFPINKYDLVSAMPSDQTHLPVVKGSRFWRKVQASQASISLCRKILLHLLPRQLGIVAANAGHPYSNFHQFQANCSNSSRGGTKQ